MVALVKMAKQQPFQRQAKQHGQHHTAQQGQRQAAEVAAQPVRQIGAQHVEAAMRQIDHTHDAEDQCESGGQHEQQQPVLHAVEQLDKKGGEIHCGPTLTMACASAAATHPCPQTGCPIRD